jgi:DNA recombination protein RmuC
MEIYVLPFLIGSLILVLIVLASVWQSRSRLRTEYAAELTASRTGNVQLEKDLAVERVHASRVPDLEVRLAKLAEQADGQKNENALLQGELAKSLATYQACQAEVLDLRTRLQDADIARGDASLRIENILKQKAEVEANLARLEEALQQERRQSDEKLGLLREARGEMTKEFKLLASGVMQEHGETFSKQNKEQMHAVLLPLREKLTEFQTGLSAAHIETLKDRATLAEQIRQLSTTSATMMSETNNLTRALKGKAQTQGAWGEMILATILEKSGLRKGEEYLIQASHTTDDGQRLRPDVIVNLPGGQRIVIDAKVSLTAFEEHVNAVNDDDRAGHLQKHLVSIRTHIKTLGSKAYQNHTNGGVDYVIMFVPIEGALAVALEEEPNMTSEAIVQNVSLATPTTLMIALRTAASVWQAERRNLNADAIAARAGQLYDKFVGFTDDMSTLGKRLEQAQSTYGDAMSKLTTGSGNLLRQAEVLKTLGAKTSKTMNINFVDEAEPPALLAAPDIVDGAPGRGSAHQLT